MTEKIFHNIFIQGPISGEFINGMIQQLSVNTTIGAISIFLGQVRNDEVDGSRVSEVEYSTHAEMALEKFHEIQAFLFENYPLTSLNVYHSTGLVRAGEYCFFVLAAARHRAEAMAACDEAVERVKAEVPIWGKLIFENATVQWKENK